MLTLGVLHGDGIGYEIVESAKAIASAAALHAGVAVQWKPLQMGEEAIKQFGTSMPDETISCLSELDGWLMGPHDSLSYPVDLQELRNPSGELRHHFDLYANIRPIQSNPFVHGVIKEADLVIFRENTEGFYVDRNMYQGVGEMMLTPDVVLTTGVFTRKAIERIAHATFQKAQQRRKRVTIVHKANVIKLGSGFFLSLCQEVGKQYPDVIVDDYHIDAMCAHFVRRMADFDVVVTENMFGDILSDLAGELVGSLGLAGSINASASKVMAQAAHGSAPDIAGKGIANPIGMIDSTALLFEWLGEQKNDRDLTLLSSIMRESVTATLKSSIATPDLGGQATTKEFTDHVINLMTEGTTCK
ncbi:MULTISPECIES: isocitrate/isopropylmalate dehydrogenase family protein [Bacillaceae]|uniref:3-isopropylmalate dehydrogenase n=1 Tax=Alkalicoccobacillus plakortidis TaxID=444060 RepID=A0A9D5DQX9_9BACI|nr:MULTISPECIES: isocitrate/isopropylmalate family dehydrogenase [Bacillaceae]KQL58455.1 3-isopropylmalate dehydrogenase [Alkalicoccobacillus plakortidis]